MENQEEGYALFSALTLVFLFYQQKKFPKELQNIIRALFSE